MRSTAVPSSCSWPPFDHSSTASVEQDANDCVYRRCRCANATFEPDFQVALERRLSSLVLAALARTLAKNGVSSEARSGRRRAKDGTGTGFCERLERRILRICRLKLCIWALLRDARTVTGPPRISTLPSPRPIQFESPLAFQTCEGCLPVLFDGRRKRVRRRS